MWLLPLLVSPAAAQQMDTANGPNSVRTISIFDEIQDSQERSLFKELWDTNDPQQGRQRAMDFVERYPRSVVLREAYELAARASATLGDDNGALEWGKRALRLLPENPLLLAMMADLAARHGQHQLAETSGRQALRYLERALAAGGNFARCVAAGAGRSAKSGGFRSWPHGGGARPLCGCRTMAAGCLAFEAAPITSRFMRSASRGMRRKRSGFGGALFRGGHESRQRRVGRGRTAAAAPASTPLRRDLRPSRSLRSRSTGACRRRRRLRVLRHPAPMPARPPAAHATRPSFATGRPPAWRKCSVPMRRAT